MNKKFSFCLWSTIVLQLLTAAFHSISFFVKPQPQNETEKQLLDLIANLFTGLSLCFTLICLFGAILNWYFKKKNLAAGLWKGLLLIEMVIFGAVFIAMAVFTFFSPIICTALIFVFVSGAYGSCKI